MKKVALIAGGIVLFLVLFYLVSGLFLTYKKPVQSSYILFEGWISYTVIEDALDFIEENNIDSVFVVGMKSSETTTCIQDIDRSKKLQKNKNTYTMSGDGILGFEIPSEKLNESSKLYFKMYGTSHNSHFPHYEIFVNGQVIGTGFVTEKDSIYEFAVTSSITDSLAYVFINFDNDFATSRGDRNLYISDIYVDSMDIDSIKTDDFFVSQGAEPNISYFSKLNTIKFYFEDLGYDTSRVKLVKVDYDPVNKSLALAKGARKYFSKIKIENINIITVNMHSRRSYLNFKNCLGENMEVGCMPGNKDLKERTSLYHGFDERVSLLATWIYWWFN